MKWKQQKNYLLRWQLTSTNSSMEDDLLMTLMMVSASSYDWSGNCKENVKKYPILTVSMDCAIFLFSWYDWWLTSQVSML